MDNVFIQKDDPFPDDDRPVFDGLIIFIDIIIHRRSGIDLICSAVLPAEAYHSRF